jgi:hypothetical protein
MIINVIQDKKLIYFSIIMLSLTCIFLRGFIAFFLMMLDIRIPISAVVQTLSFLSVMGRPFQLLCVFVAALLSHSNQWYFLVYKNV